VLQKYKYCDDLKIFDYLFVREEEVSSLHFGSARTGADLTESDTVADLEEIVQSIQKPPKLEPKKKKESRNRR